MSRNNNLSVRNQTQSPSESSLDRGSQNRRRNNSKLSLLINNQYNENKKTHNLFLIHFIDVHGSFVRAAIDRAVCRSAAQQAELDRASEVFQLKEADFADDDDLDSSSPILDLYLQESNNRKVVKMMTPFTFQEFERIWDLVGVDFMSGMTNGKGPNSTTKPKDIFFITLTVLKDPTTWDKIGLNFGMKGQKAQRIVGKALQVLAPLVKKQFIRELNKDEFRDLCIRECTNFPYVHHITDATVIP